MQQIFVGKPAHNVSNDSFISQIGPFRLFPGIVPPLIRSTSPLLASICSDRTGPSPSISPCLHKNPTPITRSSILPSTSFSTHAQTHALLRTNLSLHLRPVQDPVCKHKPRIYHAGRLHNLTCMMDCLQRMDPYLRSSNTTSPTLQNVLPDY